MIGGNAHVVSGIGAVAVSGASNVVNGTEALAVAGLGNRVLGNLGIAAAGSRNIVAADGGLNSVVLGGLDNEVKSTGNVLIGGTYPRRVRIFALSISAIHQPHLRRFVERQASGTRSPLGLRTTFSTLCRWAASATRGPASTRTT